LRAELPQLPLNVEGPAEHDASRIGVVERDSAALDSQVDIFLQLVERPGTERLRQQLGSQHGGADGVSFGDDGLAAGVVTLERERKRKPEQQGEHAQQGRLDRSDLPFRPLVGDIGHAPPQPIPHLDGQQQDAEQNRDDQKAAVVIHDFSHVEFSRSSSITVLRAQAPRRASSGAIA
jgi:hypothetical protein